MALLAGGLVGVAAPAQAAEYDASDYEYEWKHIVERVTFLDDGSFDKVTYHETNWYSYRDDESGLNEAQGKQAECEDSYDSCSIRYELRAIYPDDNNDDFAKDALDPAPAPPPCWTQDAGNNCPVGGAIQSAVPEYMIAGAPQTLLVYASSRPDLNGPGAPTNGDAVISMDGEPVAAAPFVDGVATLRFTPTAPGMKFAVISGVLNSYTSGANAWIDSIEVSTMVLPYDPEALEAVLKNKKVEVGQTYTLQEIAQAKTALGKRLEWRVAQDSKGVCSVVTTKKGEVRAKFTESGKCSIIWTDPKKDEEGKYTFKVTE